MFFAYLESLEGIIKYFEIIFTSSLVELHYVALPEICKCDDYPKNWSVGPLNQSQVRIVRIAAFLIRDQNVDSYFHNIICGVTALKL